MSKDMQFIHRMCFSEPLNCLNYEIDKLFKWYTISNAEINYLELI